MIYALCKKLWQHNFTIAIVVELLINGLCSEEFNEKFQAYFNKPPVLPCMGLQCMLHSFIEVSCEVADLKDPPETGLKIAFTTLRAAYSFEDIRHNYQILLKKKEKESCASPTINFVAVAAML